MKPEKDGPSGLTVRVLTREEKQRTRFLYEEAFPEDGPALTDYYYNRKMAGNEVFAALDSTEHARGMLCLNPYKVMVRGTEYPLSYIVAVATEKTHRREGVMRSVLTAALRRLRGRSEELRAQQLPGIPFTFLKPADPAYYSPFGFAYVSRRLRRALKQDAPVTRRTLMRRDLKPPPETETGEAAEAVSFMNAYLAERFEVYCLRDGRYLQDLLSELEAGGGHLELLLENGQAGSTGGSRIAGTAAYDYPEVPSNMVRLLAKEEYLAEAEKPAEPFIMARIVDLAAFLEVFTGENTPDHKASSVFRFYFDDPLIPENRGLWEIRAGSAARRRDITVPGVMSGSGPVPGETGLPVFSPEQLAPLLFGYRAPGQGTAGEKPEGVRTGEQELLRFLKPLRGVYFDEET